ncbi:anticodon nuclease [Erythrobacter insulae]|uniref:Anticodon nuclease n=1 Tax=Erythrobacter insulae TaxID=2584124 RepID=A0A547PAE5_9SPHN|nr:anticodon nuclease [Erythrobacter insulae]TRD11119.1 anticodon nuclease [Erythrobacter insulae]
MSQTLEQIAQALHNTNKKVQLIYAFNGTGKTRLSRALKELVAPKAADDEEAQPSRHKILYYNAFTEDLFYWDNDLLADAEPKLKIQPNSFTDWILVDQGQDQNIIANFQRYINDKLTPKFHHEAEYNDDGGRDVSPFSYVTFSFERGDDADLGNFKISKGEESNFIWSVFYTLLETVIDALQEPDPALRGTDAYDELQYVFIDDPVTSLDENHLIELAVHLAALINRAPEGLKFIITTHSPLFYNVLHNELKLSQRGKKEGCRLLELLEDGTFKLDIKHGDANRSFSYHLYLRRVLSEAIEQNKIERFHFMFLRNLYEKTAAFLGYQNWGDLLNTVPDVDAPGAKQGYLNRVMQFSSHSTLSGEQVRQPTGPEKQTVKLLFDNLINNYGYWQQEAQDG